MDFIHKIKEAEESAQAIVGMAIIESEDRIADAKTMHDESLSIERARLQELRQAAVQRQKTDLKNLYKDIRHKGQQEAQVLSERIEKQKQNAVRHIITNL